MKPRILPQYLLEEMGDLSRWTAHVHAEVAPDGSVKPLPAVECFPVGAVKYDEHMESLAAVFGDRVLSCSYEELRKQVVIEDAGHDLRTGEPFRIEFTYWQGRGPDRTSTLFLVFLDAELERACEKHRQEATAHWITDPQN